MGYFRAQGDSRAHPRPSGRLLALMTADPGHGRSHRWKDQVSLRDRPVGPGDSCVKS